MIIAIALAVLPRGDSDPKDRTPPVAADTETDLTGRWSVTALVDPDGNSVLPKSRDDIWLEFKDGTVTGSTGCNGIGGTYRQLEQDSRDIVFPGKLFTTLVGCDEEAPLLPRLKDVRHVSGEGNTRRLHAENWMIVVQLSR